MGRGCSRLAVLAALHAYNGGTRFSAGAVSWKSCRQDCVSLPLQPNVLKLVPLRTHLMVADALTNRLPSPAHIKHREIMLGHVSFSFAARTLRRTVGGGWLIVGGRKDGWAVCEVWVQGWV